MSVYDDYLKVIDEQLVLENPLDMDFKSNNKYTQILEHVWPELGYLYLVEITSKYNSFYTTNKELLIDLCNKNDLYGKTIKCAYDGFTTCSPSNLRYILHSFLILDWMAQCDLNDIDIIEIGAGYGGLCFFIKNLAYLFNINICSYKTFDLLFATKLQERYLNLLDVENVQCLTIDNFNNLKNSSFLISNYAFSELPMHLQEEYIIKIINPYTKFGFLAWNTLEVYNFVNNSIIKSEKECPQTGTSNYYVRYSPNKE